MVIVISGEHLVQLLNVKGDVIDQVEVEGTIRLAAGVSQKNPSNWGLDRIDHQIGKDYYDQLYNVTSTGEGVHIYVLDTVRNYESCYLCTLQTFIALVQNNALIIQKQTFLHACKLVLCLP